MTIESDILDLLDDGRVRPALAIAECLPQHKAASVMALVSTLAGKSQLVKVTGKGFTLPRHAPADAVGPDWAAPSIAPFQRVLLYVRKHQPVKRSTVARVLNSHVAEVNRVITECIGIGHIHQIGDMLREGADPRRAKVVGEEAPQVETANSKVSVANLVSELDAEPDEATSMTLLEGLERYEALATERGITHSAPVTLAMLRDGDEDDRAKRYTEGRAQQFAELSPVGVASGSDYDAGVLEPPPPVDVAAILNDSHAIDQDPAMPEANAIQVGGTHYRDCPIQPWDFIAANNIGFFEGNAIKYLARWREKGGVEDLRKARHYLDKLIEIETRGTL